MTRQEKIEHIARHYGVDHQCKKCVEEMAELTQALCKYTDIESCAEAKACRESIIGELADVRVMVQQIEYLLCCGNEVEATIDYKLDRQIERIKREKEKSTC